MITDIRKIEYPNQQIKIYAKGENLFVSGEL